MNSSTDYSMVGWAYGTSGLLKGCAPSNYRALQYHFMALFLLALQGMVIVAPDYAELGLDTLPDGQHIAHPWLAAPAQANDLAGAIIAARSAFPKQLKSSGPFVAMGHSQGGQAAWAFAERLEKHPISGYRGIVAIAPPTSLYFQVEEALKNPTDTKLASVLTAQPKLIAAVTASFSAYNYSGLTPLEFHLYNNVLKPTGGCIPTDTLVFNGAAPSTTAKDG